MDSKATMAALAAPFAVNEIKWKPQATKGDKAIAIAYIDARLVQDRLDDVVGVECWQDEYVLLPDGSVACQLRLRLSGEWVAKTDVGSTSEQPDGGDRMKAAYSDALKRAAVKFGIGRYLYRLPMQWCDYDQQKRRFSRTPTLPAWAIPETAAGAPAPARQSQPATKPAAAPTTADVATDTPRPAPAKGPGNMPKDGGELLARLTRFDKQLAADGVCQPGDLLEYIDELCMLADLDSDWSRFSAADIAKCVEWAKNFADERKTAKGGQT